MNIFLMNKMSAWQILIKGGPMMWVILLLSVAAFAIAMNRWIYLTQIERKLILEKQVLLESLRLGNLKETLRLCEQGAGLLAGILKAGILKFGASRDLIKGCMEESFEFEAARVKGHIDILSMIVNLAPLMGLLGTVSAMTVVFHAVVIRSNALNPSTAGDLAAGIWQALLTTAAGLLAAIFSFGMYGILAARVNAVLGFVQRAIIEMTNVLLQLSELKRVSQGQGHER